MAATMIVAGFRIDGNYCCEARCDIYITISKDAGMSEFFILKPRMGQALTRLHRVSVFVRDQLKSLSNGTEKLKSWGTAYTFDADKSDNVKAKAAEAILAFVDAELYLELHATWWSTLYQG